MAHCYLLNCHLDRYKVPRSTIAKSITNLYRIDGKMNSKLYCKILKKDFLKTLD